MSNLQYGQDGEGAFWVTDYQPILLADPTAPQLVNSNVGYITDENGDSAFGKMVEIGRLAASNAKVIDYMKEMSGVAASVANGDLIVEVKLRSEKDAFGNAFSQMISRQRALIGKTKGVVASVAEASKQLTRASEQTAQAAQQIASTIQQIAKGANEQATSLQETASSVDQLSGAISQIAEGSQEQARFVDEAGEIVNKVSAATEAARGGEQGRGFAVVADEVRKLAERSSLATKEKTSIVDGIRTGVTEAVSAMQQGGKEVEGGYKLDTS